MKMIRIMLLSFILITACQAKQSDKAKNIKKHNASEITFKDTYGGYTLSYPIYWKINDHSTSKNMIRADIYKDDLVGFQIRMYKITDFYKFTDSYIKTFLSEMQGHWKGTIKEEKREFFGTKDYEICKVWIYAEKQNGESWFFKEYLFQNKNKIIVFQSGIYLAYKETYEGKLDEIADSFRFIRE